MVNMKKILIISLALLTFSCNKKECKTKRAQLEVYQTDYNNALFLYNTNPTQSNLSNLENKKNSVDKQAELVKTICK